MTKTLKSDKEGGIGAGSDGSNHRTFDLLIEGSNGGVDTMKGRSQQKP